MPRSCVGSDGNANAGPGPSSSRSPSSEWRSPPSPVPSARTGQSRSHADPGRTAEWRHRRAHDARGGRGAILRNSPGDVRRSCCRSSPMPGSSCGRRRRPNGPRMSWSPEGTALAYVWANAVWVLDTESGGSTKIVDRCVRMCSVAWSPDGSVIALANGGTLELVNVDGTGLTTVRTSTSVDSPVWSPDGQRIDLPRVERHALPIDLNGSDLQALGVNGLAAAWSPDGLKMSTWPILRPTASRTLAVS